MKLPGAKRKRQNKAELLSPSSPFAFTEAYRALRTNLAYASMAGKYQKILITSAAPAEGKSSVTINLAAALHASGAKVLIIDCDLRSPSIHRYLRLRGRPVPGLSAALSGTADPDRCILSLDAPGIDVMPAEPVPPNPAELLGSEKMREILNAVENSYDYILCDTPSVSLVADAMALCPYCDGVLLVVRQNYAAREQIRSAKENLEAAGAKIIGTVLNRYDIRDDAAGSSRRFVPYGSSRSGYGK